MSRFFLFCGTHENSRGGINDIHSIHYSLETACAALPDIYRFWGSWAHVVEIEDCTPVRQWIRVGDKWESRDEELDE